MGTASFIHGRLCGEAEQMCRSTNQSYDILEWSSKTDAACSRECKLCIRGCTTEVVAHNLIDEQPQLSRLSLFQCDRGLIRAGNVDVLLTTQQLSSLQLRTNKHNNFLGPNFVAHHNHSETLKPIKTHSLKHNEEDSTSRFFEIKILGFWPQKFGHPPKKIGKIMKNSAIDSFWSTVPNPVIKLRLHRVDQP
jgi:hypothetical protein